jgi:hypothetical protein
MSSYTAMADNTPPVEIEITEVSASSDCYEDEFSVNLMADGFGGTASVLEGQFSEMTATAFADGPRTEKRSCRVRYNLHVPYGYRIVQMDFNAAGFYSVDDGGNVRATIGHKVGIDINRRVTIQKRGEAFTDSGELSDLVDNESFSNPIYGADLAPEFRKCGATIPVRTDLIIHATQSSRGDLSEISLDTSDAAAEAELGPVTYKRLGFCRVKLVPCS